MLPAINIPLMSNGLEIDNGLVHGVELVNIINFTLEKTDPHKTIYKMNGLLHSLRISFGCV